jgi:glycosyltransferase involved in cell wall biosynthesis
MKRILFITAFPPTRLTAGQNYTKELLNVLSERHEIDLIYFTYPGHEIEVNSKINILKKVNVSKLSKVYSWLHLPLLHPFFVLRFRFSLLLFLVKNRKKYDFLYFDFSQVFIYSMFIKKTFKIFMCHDVIYQKLKRTNYFYLNPFNSLLFFTEKLILETSDLILSFSEKDKKLIKESYNLNSEVVSFFISDKIKLIDYREINLTRKFIFFGAWNRPENMEGLIWFVNKVLPFVDDNIIFEIIGPSIDELFLAEIKSIDKMQYLGFLDNPYLKIAESQALIAPIFQGAGVKVKVIESLATGTPVIGTEIAFEGITVAAKNAMFLCRNAEDFIHKINFFPYMSIDDKQENKLLFDKSYAPNKIENILSLL